MDNFWLAVGYVLVVGVGLGLWAKYGGINIIWGIVLVVAAIILMAILGYPLVMKC